MAKKLRNRALHLTEYEKLADNCPRCFGPLVRGKGAAEADFIVCFDANFQQQRHLSASVERQGQGVEHPELFLPPKEVLKWERRVQSFAVGRRGDVVSSKPALLLVQPLTLMLFDDPLYQDPCTKSHTAAADIRTGTAWKASDEAGLYGMACRHDHLLKFINIVQSGER